MKLKNYLNILKENTKSINEAIDDDDDDIIDDNEGFYYGGEDEELMYDIDEDDDEDEEEESGDVSKRVEREYSEGEEEAIEHLASTIRGMISNLKITDFYVDYDNFDISIQFVLNKKERMGHLMKIMGLMKKLQTDILIQYEAEVDLWESKEREPLLTFNFFYNEDVKGYYKTDDLPF